MSGEFLDAMKVLVSPCEKLIAATQSAIGKAYEPRYIRRMADAKAYEIRQIGQALSDSVDIPITYKKDELTMNTTDIEEIIKRTQTRLAFQEIRKQANIENVVDSAYNELENETAVESDSPDLDWLLRFFNSVEDISNDQMQKIWGKILAGEIKKPHTFSLRTLGILKNLTQEEADLFKRVSPYVFSCPGNDEKTFVDYFLPAPGLLGSDTLHKHGIPFSDILVLSEAGLVNHNPIISISMHLNQQETDFIIGSKNSIEFYNGSDSAVRLSHSAYILTEAGKELFPIVFDTEYNATLDSYVADFIDGMKNVNSLSDNSNSAIELKVVSN